MHIAGAGPMSRCARDNRPRSRRPRHRCRSGTRSSRSCRPASHQGQILAGLVAAYGPGILEKPEARGAGLVVWVLPVLALVAAIAGLAVAFARWRPRRSAPVTPAERELVEQALRDAGSGDHLRGDPGRRAGAAVRSPATVAPTGAADDGD